MGVVETAVKTHRTTSKQPGPVDTYVGLQVKLRRLTLGLSMEEIGAQLGLTFQQIQKYESGATRIGVARLYALSIVLKVPVGYFFDGIDASKVLESRSGILNVDLDRREINRLYKADSVRGESQELLTLVRAYRLVRHEHTRKCLMNLMTAISSVAREPA